MKILSRVKSYTKEGYKDALLEACDDLKSKVDDILCDYNRFVKDITITIRVEPGCVSLLEINKRTMVATEEDDNNDEE